jgi:Flavodoxin domain
MVRAVVVYESVYGNTRAVAEAIAAGLADHADVALRRVAEVDAEALHGARLLVVGGPTHMHGLATSLSRRMAVKAAEEDGHTDVEPHASEEPGLRAWLSALDGADLSAAAFDTRIDRSAALTGSAARGISRRLHRRGFTLVADPESFFVEDGEGPLEEGELARARAWGASLAAGIQGAPR